MEMLLFSAAAGVGGMFLGGIISALLSRKSSEKAMSGLLAFAAGVMISIVCFKLIGEFFEDYTLPVIFGVISGIIAMMILNGIAEKIMSKSNKNHNNLLRSGTFMLIAMALHNIPEGMAIGAGGSYDFRLGVVLTIIMALHTIPEGMAVVTPLMVGGAKKGIAILLVSLAGSTMFLGGVLGVLAGGISDAAIAVSLAAAGGAMIYIVFAELIPHSISMGKGKTAPILIMIGILVGLIAAAF